MSASEYSTTFTVHFGYCDFENKMTPEYILKQLQQVSMEHTDREGVTTDFLYAHNVAFLLAKIKVDIQNVPKGGQRVHAKTWAFAPQRAQYVRITSFYNENEELLLTAISRWVLIDIKQRHIIRQIPDFLDKPMFHVEGTAEDFRMPRFSFEDIIDKVHVKYAMIDINRHVNNAVYANFAANCMPKLFFDKEQLSCMEIYYIHEALLNDEIVLYKKEETDNNEKIVYIHGALQDRPCFESKFTFIKSEGKANE